MASWIAFGKLQYIQKNKNININSKRKVDEIFVLPVTIYELELGLEASTHRKKRRNVKSLSESNTTSLRNKLKNEDIRRKTKISDLIQNVSYAK